MKKINLLAILSLSLLTIMSGAVVAATLGFIISARTPVTSVMSNSILRKCDCYYMACCNAFTGTFKI